VRVYVEIQTDPLHLWSVQTERRKQWVSIQATFILAVLAAPIVLAATQQELPQILKLGYPFIGIFLALTVNHIGSATSLLSAVISLIVCFLVFSITLPIAQWITGMSPNPGWYTTVIPLYVFLDVMNETIIPAKERMEWKGLKSNTGITDKELLTRLANVDLSNQYAKKTYANVFATKVETFWERLGITTMKRARTTSSCRVITSHAEVKKNNKQAPKKLQRKNQEDSDQYTGEADELHELQRQASESMKRIQGEHE
jgi:hypothetical protein